MGTVRDSVRVDGHGIAFERAGDGPALVLLQGFVGDGRSTWGDQLDELSDEFTVIAWDAPGAGESSDPPAWFRLPDYADCLSGFFAALDLDRPHLCGLSFGGALAIELEDRYPGLAASLILASAYAGWAGSLPAETVAERLQSSLDLAEQPPSALVDALAPTMFSPTAAGPAVDAFRASVAEVRAPGFRAMARSSAEADLRPALARIAVPTLLLYGENDVRAPLHVAQALHDGIPGSRLVVLPGVGHVSCVEAPGPFNQQVRAFLHAVQG